MNIIYLLSEYTTVEGATIGHYRIIGAVSKDPKLNKNYKFKVDKVTLNDPELLNRIAKESEANK